MKVARPALAIGVFGLSSLGVREPNVKRVVICVVFRVSKNLRVVQDGYPPVELPDPDPSSRRLSATFASASSV
jgi:hypothetical protein